MVTFPNCKINIGLYIKEQREDGYHNLETIFYPVPFTDVLEIIRSDEVSSAKKYVFSTSGLTLDIHEENNICIRAYNLIRNYLGSIPHVRVHLHKNIPSGAGLGGGSADGAFTLRLLNDLLKLGLQEEEIAALSLELGSDCPFFLKNRACYAKGRGEILEDISLDLKGYYLVLVSPDIHISTADLFMKVRHEKALINLKQLSQLPVAEWRDVVNNDFESAAFALHPAIKAIKDSLYKQGAVYASMTGTGSTVYALFTEDIPIEINEKYTINKFLL